MLQEVIGDGVCTLSLYPSYLLDNTSEVNMWVKWTEYNYQKTTPVLLDWIINCLLLFKICRYFYLVLSLLHWFLVLPDTHKQCLGASTASCSQTVFVHLVPTNCLLPGISAKMLYLLGSIYAAMPLARCGISLRSSPYFTCFMAILRHHNIDLSHILTW